ncbi:MAG TPA: hypothetical protein VF849_01445 [Blattabacteriaceae bacterium]
MIIVENITFKNEKKYIQVRIHTACCKSTFMVEDQGKDKLWNPITEEYILWGMVNSIRLAEDTYNERILKTNKM